MVRMQIAASASAAIIRTPAALPPDCPCGHHLDHAWPNVRHLEMLTAEERDVVARAKLGGGRADNVRKHSSKRLLDRDLPASVPQYSYPANAPPKTLGLLGKLDALQRRNHGRRIGR